MPREFVDVWLRARSLGDEPDGEWTFPRMIFRAMAMDEPDIERLAGIDLMMEELSHWDEVVSGIAVMNALVDKGWEGPHGLSIQIGMKVYESMFRTQDGRITVPTMNEAFRGRHAVMAVDFDWASDSIVFANSWGEDWGDRGFGYISREYFDACVDGVWLKRPTWLGPSKEMERTYRSLRWRRGDPDGSNWKSYIDSWATPNRLQGTSIRLASTELTLLARQVISFWHGHFIQVLELRQEGRLCGRLDMAHNPEQKSSTITELWVPPAERRKGFGTKLDEIAVETAMRQGNSELLAQIHEADWSTPGKLRATHFAEALGYEWTESRDSVRPNICAKTSKSLE